MTNTRPILHVSIIDDLTGEQLADVDARSTADAMAYFVSSRGLDPCATEESVAVLLGHGLDTSNRLVPSNLVPIIFEQRCPITGVLERALVARATWVPEVPVA